MHQDENRVSYSDLKTWSLPEKDANSEKSGRYTACVRCKGCFNVKELDDSFVCKECLDIESLNKKESL